MNHRLKQQRQEAKLLTHVILAWHREIGARLALQKMADSPESLDRYRRLLDRFADSDLSDPQIQNEISHEQLSGTFEWFYGAEIPDELLRKWQRSDDFEQEVPRYLHEAAKRILAINERMPHTTDEPESRGRTVVEFSDNRDLMEKARHVYQGLTAEENVGIGGSNFLLACSIERRQHQERHRSLNEPVSPHHKIVLIDESVLGVERMAPGSRPNDLLDQLRFGTLVFKAALGEPSASETPREGGEG